ncbi:MAG TPA: hypothetical protein DCE41_07435 [Cytophagales bacterium]|nr:hypothetical protein [Cytophagales bacterium]HAA20775.1 hypothetical protein [Cytophagales bacterium]HAP62065.1 hypothetical protein [Cytophagales bacterium]
MSAIPYPENETERVKALHRYQLLDQPIDDGYQQIVELASQIADTPISLISLLDADRQWSVALTGIDVREIQREYAPCTLAIFEDDLFEVPDMRDDERFADNPLVHGDTNLQYYAGIPLETPDGYKLGTLCVLDQKPKKLSQEQVFALQVLSQQVINSFQLRFRNLEMTSQVEELARQNRLIDQQKKDLSEANSRIRDMNQSLLELNGSLESSVRERTKALTKLTKELDTFLYRSSHDLLRPITSLEGLALLAEEVIKSPEAKELFGKVTDTAQGMKVLLRKLLQAHQIINARKYTGEVDVAFLIALVQQAIQERYPEANWNIHLNTSGLSQPWKTEGHLLRVVLENLLENSWQYRQRGQTAPPKINIRVFEQEDQVVLEVWDNCCGMLPEVQTKAFEMFYRGSEGSVGNGLGLYLVAKTIEYMGGKISLESSHGVGSRFTFLFPASEAQPQQASASFDPNTTLISSIALSTGS